MALGVASEGSIDPNWGADIKQSLLKGMQQTELKRVSARQQAPIMHKAHIRMRQKPYWKPAISTSTHSRNRKSVMWRIVK